MNGQEVKVASNCDSPYLCAVKAGLCIYHHSIRLGKSADDPFGVYKTASDSTTCFISKQMANFLQRAAINVHHLTDQAEIYCYISHYLRFWDVYMSVYSNSSSLENRNFPFVFMQHTCYWRHTLFYTHKNRQNLIRTKKSTSLSKYNLFNSTMHYAPYHHTL